MTDNELIQTLRAHAEWLRDSELSWAYPVPYSGVEKAADRLANQNTHILALQKEIEGLRAQLPRWIPVTERLPEPPEVDGGIKHATD